MNESLRTNLEVSENNDYHSNEGDTDKLVRKVTSHASSVILPLIEALSNLEKDEV